MYTDTYHAFMLDYAAGNLAPEMALAAHLHEVLSPDGAKNAEIWSKTKSLLTKSDNGSDLSDAHNRLPEVLELAHGSFDDLPWRTGLSGVSFAKRGPDRGQLMRLNPGQAAPSHTHSALEATVVLVGEFADGHGTYKRGDIALAHPGKRHQPAAIGDVACICFVAKEPTPFWRFS